jgi:hypothetical protein
MRIMFFKKILALALTGALLSCGGGGGGGGDVEVASAGAPARMAGSVFRSPLTAAPIVAGQTQITLVSDAGDFVGAGQSFAYTQADAVITVRAEGGHLRVAVGGDEQWTGDFELPAPHEVFDVDEYLGVTRYPFHQAEVGGLNWGGGGRGCGPLAGSFRINSSEYAGAELVAIDLDFVQQCEGATGALHGSIRWFASDPTSPPRPVREIPSTLWAPLPGSTPSGGTFVHLESSSVGDPIGGGIRATYTPRNAQVAVAEFGGHLTVSVTGDERWSGDFQVMAGVARLRPGWYPALKRYPVHNPTKGGMYWSGERRSCNQVEAWFVVDEVTYVDGELVTLDMRFQQHCEWAGAPALNGRIRWDINDRTGPPLPRRAALDRLWQPAPGAPIPATGNYVYLHSEPGDFVGGGMHGSYSAGISVGSSGSTVSVSTNGYSGTFIGMSSIPRLRRGYYPNLQSTSRYNPARGGMLWSTLMRRCWEIEGWFAIDHIRYDSVGSIIELDMRFMQSCEGTQPPLRGAIHWVRPS